LLTFSIVKSSFSSLIICIICTLVLGCRTRTNNNQEGKPIFAGQPEQLLAGNFDFKIEIDSLVGAKNNYAFGVLDSLKGVFQVFDGQPYVSTLLNDSLVVNTKTEGQAVFFVQGQVGGWQQTTLPASVANTEALVGFLHYNEDLNIDTDTPFLFLIEGVVEQLEWRIIPKNGADDNPTVNADRQNAGTGTLTNKYVEIVGVYSSDHQSIFSSEKIPVHMHFKTADNTLAGHVDQLELGPEMSLRIPVSK